MFCDLRTLRRRAPQPLAAGVFLASVLVLSLGCGHKKSPVPPPSKVPQKVTLKAHQRGNEVVMSFPLPTTTISGTALPGISKVEVYQFGVEFPEFAVELLEQEKVARREARDLLDELGLPLVERPALVDPEAAPGTEASGEPADEAPTPDDKASASESSPDIAVAGEPDEEPAAGDDETAEGEPELTEEELLAQQVEAARALLISPPTPKAQFITASMRDFDNGAELVRTIEGDAVRGSLIGDTIALRLPLPPRPTEGPEIGYLYSAKVYPPSGNASDLSDFVAILPSDTPPAPQDVSVAAQAQGIFVRWNASEKPSGGFRVYRRDAQTRLYGEPIKVLPLGTERFFLDQQAIFGARYIYGVTAVETPVPLLEGDMSSEHEIDYQDRFGPATPGGLVAFPEAGRVRLLWTTVPDVDIAGYEVSRRASPDEDFVPITTDLVTRGQYLDETVASGDVWFYSVVAIDTSGNRSPASAETEARVP